MWIPHILERAKQLRYELSSLVGGDFLRTTKAGDPRLRGNERADYLAKIAASYKTTIDYNSIPITRGKQLLKEYYESIWNLIYTKSNDAFHTKKFIPNIPYRLSLSLWPNHITTQFLTNHGLFNSYLHKMNKAASPYCNCPEKSLQTCSPEIDQLYYKLHLRQILWSFT